MSNDGSKFRPWKIQKGVFKSTGVSDYASPRDTPSPIVEFPVSPTSIYGPSSCPSSPPIVVLDADKNPLFTSNNTDLPKIHFTIRNIPIEKVINRLKIECKLSSLNCILFIISNE
jgi:hypothetical protein